jgi:phosphate transport system substrate-binding protein
VRGRAALAAALLLALAVRPGAVEASQLMQDLRCMKLSRAVLGDDGCVPMQKLLIGGSAVMVFYTRPLAEEFEKRNPGIRVEITGGNSADDLAAVDHGSIGLAAIARDLAPKEYRPELRVTMIGRDGLVAVVNRANPLSDLSKDQLRALFTGETIRWPDGRPVHVVSRNQGSASLQSFEEIVLGGAKVTAKARETKRTADMASAVAADPDAIGFVGLHGVTPEIKALTIDGVPVTDATILSSRYPLVRSLNLVEEGEEAGEPKRLFVEFAAGPDGQALIEKAGAVRVD